MDLHWFLFSCIVGVDLVFGTMYAWYFVFWSGAVILLSGAVIPNC
jgi:hypothetical protein